MRLQRSAVLRANSYTAPGETYNPTDEEEPLFLPAPSSPALQDISDDDIVDLTRGKKRVKRGSEAVPKTKRLKQTARDQGSVGHGDTDVDFGTNGIKVNTSNNDTVSSNSKRYIDKGKTDKGKTSQEDAPLYRAEMRDQNVMAETDWEMISPPMDEEVDELADDNWDEDEIVAEAGPVVIKKGLTGPHVGGRESSPMSDLSIDFSKYVKKSPAVDEAPRPKPVSPRTAWKPNPHSFAAARQSAFPREAQSTVSDPQPSGDRSQPPWAVVADSNPGESAVSVLGLLGCY